ncbi:MAG: MgtC/SapB family protein, partial [Bauldia sp.]|nr:MgtC/SapB family protein [Bauldia sp.]
GVERGWREREEAEGDRAAGLRTFTLIGLFGGVWGLLAHELGPAPFGLAFLAIAGALTLFRWRETEAEGTRGMTTLVAGFLAFSLGAYAVLGSMAVAAAAAVATTALLAAKEWLHAWLRVLTWRELRAALILLGMSFVALPVLPDRGYGPYGALNPYEIWLMTVVIAGVSFIGYVAVKLAGERYGSLIAGIAGGLVSSTVTTVDLARRAKAEPENRRLLLSGALAASTVMFVRIGVVVGLFGPVLLGRLTAPLAAAAIVSAAAAVIFNRPWAKQAAGENREQESRLTNPFELRQVLGFGLLLAVILILTRALTEIFGVEGGIALAAIAGLADVDAITLSMTRMAGDGTLDVAATAILVAAAANSLSKSGLALFAGGRAFGAGYLAVTLVSLVVGAAAAWVLIG